jgi:hypothetical protein
VNHEANPSWGLNEFWKFAERDDFRNSLLIVSARRAGRAPLNWAGFAKKRAKLQAKVTALRDGLPTWRLDLSFQAKVG